MTRVLLGGTPRSMRLKASGRTLSLCQVRHAMPRTRSSISFAMSDLGTMPKSLGAMRAPVGSGEGLDRDIRTEGKRPGLYNRSPISLTSRTRGLKARSLMIVLWYVTSPRRWCHKGSMTACGSGCHDTCQPCCVEIREALASGGS